MTLSAWVQRLGAACLILTGAPLGAIAQTTPEITAQAPVNIAADRVTVMETGRLIAEGNVVIETQGKVLTAARVAYDQTVDRVVIDGPIRIEDGPDVLVLADAADLDVQLRDGVISGIRVLLNQRMQIAAAEARRRQDRFTDMREAVATSCEVCRPGEPPLWQLQARRVVHDEEGERVYFEKAKFLIWNMPVLYLPALSTPAPGVKRQSGFLVPSGTTSDLFGTGLKIPYFQTIGDHADLTFAPRISTDLQGAYSRTLEYRYRQAFTTGTITFDGAFSEDSLYDDGTRAYLFGSGAFELPKDFKLSFGVQLVRDDSYLNDYDFSSTDRLENSLTLTRVKGETRTVSDVVVFKSLRTDEDNDTLPILVGDARFDHRLTLPAKTGFLDTSLIAHGHQRPSNTDVDGRDSTHLRGVMKWSASTTDDYGMRFTADARVVADAKQIYQDSNYPEYQTDLTPGVAVTASLPMVATGGDAVNYLLEPIAQLVWSGSYDIDAPNDDSTLPALDSGNLMGFQRFPGLDRSVAGSRANLAMRWKRQDTDGVSLGLTLGRVLRFKPQDLFSSGTGLSGARSDWLAVIDADLKEKLTLRSLTLIKEDLSATLNETRLGYNGNRFDLTAGYVWLVEDEALGQATDLSEVVFTSDYQVTQTWAAGLDLRRDLFRDRTVRTQLGVTYQNECIKVDVFGLRRFRNTEDAEPTYSYGVTVSLTGFGTGGGPQRQVGRCAG